MISESPRKPILRPHDKVVKMERRQFSVKKFTSYFYHLLSLDFTFFPSFSLGLPSPLPHRPLWLKDEKIITFPATNLYTRNKLHWNVLQLLQGKKDDEEMVWEKKPQTEWDKSKLNIQQIYFTFICRKFFSLKHSSIIFTQR